MERLVQIHFLLFLFTFATTTVAGALQQGVNPFASPGDVWRGLPFSLTLLLILGAHEFGHWWMAKRHRMRVTLPYFISAPSLIGTFGAFIKMQSPILDRRTLLDIGVAGPFAGLIVAVPILFAGLALSQVRPTAGVEGIALGSSLLFSFAAWIIHGVLPDTIDLVLHPVAFSGWIGLLVTCLNLLPVDQLDGGYVAYALFGARQRPMAFIIVALLAGLGIFGWNGWLLWAGILLVMGFRHPPVIYDSDSPGRTAAHHRMACPGDLRFDLLAGAVRVGHVIRIYSCLYS